MSRMDKIFAKHNKKKEAQQKAKQKEFDEAVARKVAETISNANSESTALAN